jgi:hypothetical protein
MKLNMCEKVKTKIPSSNQEKRSSPPVQNVIDYNSLWSIWCGVFTLCLQVFIVRKCVKRFLIYTSIPWPGDQHPYQELNIYAGIVAFGGILLPFIFISYIFKIGNLSNDGYKLGYMDNPSVLESHEGVIMTACHLGGPTSSLLHLVSAFCFLLPSVFIEARLIQVGFLSRGKEMLRLLIVSLHNLFQITFGKQTLIGCCQEKLT